MGASDSRFTHSRRLGLALALAIGGALVATPGAQQVTFRSAVDMVVVDTQVLDRDGVPVDKLGAKDFQVWINNQSRRVVSADLVRYPLETAVTIAPSADQADWIHGELPEVRGRIIVLAIDELSFGQRDLRVAVNTMKQFIAQLQPDDVIGLYAYPLGTGRVDLTHYHSTINKRLDEIEGLAVPFDGAFMITPSEVVDLTARDSIAMNRVIARECPGVGRDPSRPTPQDMRQNFADGTVINPLSLQDPTCPARIQSEANQRAVTQESQTTQSYLGLRDLLAGLAALPGPKTVVMVSAGMLSSDRVGGRPDVTGLLKTAGRDAAAADATLYVLHVDNHYLEAEEQMGTFHTHYTDDLHLNEMRDASTLALGLQQVAGEAGGEYFRISAGTGINAFNRVLKETSAYYLLGVQPEAVDRDGRVHTIRVKANAKNATVRSRTQVTIPKS